MGTAPTIVVFSGLPGGTRSTYGTFRNIGKFGGWWSSTEDFTYDAWSRYLGYDDGEVSRYYSDKTRGLSVRCLKD